MPARKLPGTGDAHRRFPRSSPLPTGFVAHTAYTSGGTLVKNESAGYSRCGSFPTASVSMQSTAPTPETPGSFAELDLCPEIMRALQRAGYETPSPVQRGFIPEALNEKDVVGQARTGTGKTAAFAIPILECVPLDGPKSPFALVLVPTRELAAQVVGEFEKLSFGLPIKTIALYGGSSMKSQLVALKAGVDIVVGTPGRVLDHLHRRTLDISELEFVVLDEADRMLDIGFRPDIERILHKCPRDRQTLLLSATLPPPILRLAQRYMRDPVMLNFSREEIAVETIEQHYFTVEENRKFELLVKLLQREKPAQAIVFCRTKRRTQWLYLDLSREFQNVGCMHGDMPQKQRERVMAKFRQGSIKILVATDVVGRGIDVTAISHIINYDVPQDSDDYVHRVGRTGRMGREGVAFTFVTPDQGSELTSIEMLIDHQLMRDHIEGFDLEVKRGPATAEQSQGSEPPPALGRAKKRYRRAL